MVPTFNVKSYVSYVPERVRTLTGREVINGFTQNHEYEPMIDICWADVRSTLSVERVALERASASPDADAYEAELEAIHDQLCDDNEIDPIDGLDLGIAALVRALIASGGVTFTSCRGRIGRASIHQHPHPFVGVVLDGRRAALVSELVLKSGCCLYEPDQGLLAIGGSSLEGMHALARELANSAHVFDMLPPPAWAESIAALSSEERAR